MWHASPLPLFLLFSLLPCLYPFPAHHHPTSITLLACLQDTLIFHLMPSKNFLCPRDFALCIKFLHLHAMAFCAGHFCGTLSCLIFLLCLFSCLPARSFSSSHVHCVWGDRACHLLSVAFLSLSISDWGTQWPAFWLMHVTFCLIPVEQAPFYLSS